MRYFMVVFVFKIDSLGISLCFLFFFKRSRTAVILWLSLLLTKNEVGPIKMWSFMELTNEKDHHYFLNTVHVCRC